MVSQSSLGWQHPSFFWQLSWMNHSQRPCVLDLSCLTLLFRKGQTIYLRSLSVSYIKFDFVTLFQVEHMKQILDDKDLSSSQYHIGEPISNSEISFKFCILQVRLRIPNLFWGCLLLVLHMQMCVFYNLLGWTPYWELTILGRLRRNVQTLTVSCWCQ